MKSKINLLIEHKNGHSAVPFIPLKDENLLKISSFEDMLAEITENRR